MPQMLYQLGYILRKAPNKKSGEGNRVGKALSAIKSQEEMLRRVKLFIEDVKRKSM